MEPDFEVRNLSEYSVEDLEILLAGIRLTTLTKISSMSTDQVRQSLDIWAYRIKDALSQAKKNEVTKV